jgi:sialate O-acetylesterase
VGRILFAIVLAAVSAQVAAGAPAAVVYVTSPIFADHMVLQRNRPAPIWGVGAPVGGSITVSIAGRSKSTTVGQDGHWRVYIDPLPAGGPYTLEVRATKTIAFNDVVLGDVWLCSGQSNMSRGVAPIRERQAYQLIRTFRHDNWEETPSEMAWWLGRYLYDSQQVPIGLINEAVSGSNIRTWLPEDVAQDLPPGLIDQLGPYVGLNYRDLIEPLTPFAMSGVFWWQGESDSYRYRAEIYGDQLAGLIRSWRRHFERNDLAFIYIMLPTGRGSNAERDSRPLPSAPDAHPSADDVNMFEAYLSALTLPNTGMVVTKDLASGLHPYRRDLFAERMVLWARHLVYGENLVYSGPILQSVAREGNRLRIHYRPGTAEGLYAFPPYPLQGFTISDDGVNFVWANSEIQGDEVVVWSDAIFTPTELRYAWAYYSRWANLANGDDMAAAPFRFEVPPP